MNIYYFVDYRLVLKTLIEEQKNKNNKLNYSKLANDLGIQKTYISKVINGSAHLSTDQVYLIADYFSLSEEELDYFLLLLEYERSGVAIRKKKLLKKINYVQSQHRSIKKHLKTNSIDPLISPLGEFYLDPYVKVVHIFLSISFYQKNYLKIAEQLQISQTQLTKIVNTLEKSNIIQWVPASKSYKILSQDLLLPKESPLCVAHQNLFRTISAQQILRLPIRDSLGMQITFSADDRTKNKIHERFLEFLKEMEILVKNATSEKVYQFNFDLFPWFSE